MRFALLLSIIFLRTVFAGFGSALSSLSENASKCNKQLTVLPLKRSYLHRNATVFYDEQLFGIAWKAGCAVKEAGENGSSVRMIKIDKNLGRSPVCQLVVDACIRFGLLDLIWLITERIGVSPCDVDGNCNAVQAFLHDNRWTAAISSDVSRICFPLRSATNVSRDTHNHPDLKDFATLLDLAILLWAPRIRMSEDIKFHFTSRNMKKSIGISASTLFATIFIVLVMLVIVFVFARWNSKRKLEAREDNKAKMLREEASRRAIAHNKIQQWDEATDDTQHETSGDE